MFGHNNKRLAEETLSTETFKTFIDAKTVVEGRMSFANSVRIDGKVLGDVLIDGDGGGLVAVGPGAEVRGNVSARRVLIAGTVQGNVQGTDNVQLLAGARVSGDISYGAIAIVCGARVNGLLVDLAKDGAPPEAQESTSQPAHEERRG
jgi:cytoskeletal protein CcmA (bactofilin family)